MKPYYVYMVECADGSLYTGITTDIERRLDQHNGITPGGARYTKQRRPVTLAYCEEVSSRSEATKREYALKKLPRDGKMALVKGPAE